MDFPTRASETHKTRELEIRNLVCRSTWVMVLEADVPKDANMITGSFVVSNKDVETDKPNSE